MPPPFLSAVVLSYRHPDALAATLSALSAQTRPPDEVLVVDQGTPEAALAPLRARFPRVSWVLPGANLGYTGGMNLGLSRSRGELLLLVCDDLAPEPGCLAALEAALAEDDGAAVACGLQRAGEDPSRFAYCGGEVLTGSWPGLEVWTEPRGTRPYETGYATGAALLVRRGVLKRLGGFEAGFFLYWEDVDLSLRLRRSGQRILCVPGAAFRTFPVPRTLGPSDQSAVHFHKLKNAALLMARHAAPGGLAAFLCRLYGAHLPRALWRGPDRLAALRAAAWLPLHPGSLRRWRPVTDTLAGRVAGGFLSLAWRQAALAAVQLATGIFLARRVAPSAFGAFAVLWFLQQTLSLLATLGLGEALTRREAPAREAGAAWTLQLVAALLAGGLLAAGAGPERLYAGLPPEDRGLLPFMGLAVLLGALRAVPAAGLERGLRFRELAVLEWSSGFLACAVSWLMAWRGMGLGALVAGALAREALLTAGVLRLSGGSPAWPSRAQARALLAEGAPFWSSALLAMANSAALPLYLGKRLGMERLGYVSWAAGQGLRPQQFSDLAGRVLYPAFASLQDRPEAMGRAVRRALGLAASAVFPVAALLIALADPLIRLVYTERWLPARGALCLYAAALVPILANLVAVRALLALGESRRVLLISLLTTALLWAVMVLATAADPMLRAPLALAAANAAGFAMTGTLLKRRVPVALSPALGAPLLAAAAAGLAAHAGTLAAGGWAGLGLALGLGCAAGLLLLAAAPERPLGELRRILR